MQPGSSCPTRDVRLLMMPFVAARVTNLIEQVKPCGLSLPQGRGKQSTRAVQLREKETPLS